MLTRKELKKRLVRRAEAKREAMEAAKAAEEEAAGPRIVSEVLGGGMHGTKGLV